MLAGLQSQVADLAARVKMNSQNSSEAAVVGRAGDPGAEVAAREVRAKPGRPKGQPGATMQLSDHPDKRVRHRPAGAGAAGSP